MPNTKELVARLQNKFKFHPVELKSLALVILATAFIFSFRDWGVDTFDIFFGLRHLLALLVISAIVFFVWLSAQKAYGLAKGYAVEYQVWWLGVFIALGLAFITLGKLPLVLIGGVGVTFLPKRRLGEQRYGFSYYQAGMIAFWGILGLMILAIIFALGLRYLPDSYFFAKGLTLILIMSVLLLVPFDLLKLKFPRLPAPHLPGLRILFASHILYLVAWITVILTGILLLTHTTAGLVIAVLGYGLAGIIAFLLRSEK